MTSSQYDLIWEPVAVPSGGWLQVVAGSQPPAAAPERKPNAGAAVVTGTNHGTDVSPVTNAGRPVRLALWLLVRLVPLQKAIIQIDLDPQLLRGVSQLLNQFGIGKPGDIIRFLLFSAADSLGPLSKALE